MSTPRRYVSIHRESKYDSSLVTPGGMESDDEDSEFGFSDDDDDIRNVIGVNPNRNNAQASCSNSNSDQFANTPSIFAPINNDEALGKSKISDGQLSSLYNAVCEGNLEAVKKIIESDVHVDTQLRCGWNALMFACNRTADAIVYYLLEKGADANYNHDGFTALMVACASSDKAESVRLKCVNLLIQYKADVNAYNKNHMSALMLAARDGKKWIVECLLRNGANPLFLFNSGWSALHWAISSGYAEVAKMLLEANPALEKITPGGMGLVEFARDKDQPHLAKMLEKYVQTKIFSTDVEEEAWAEQPSPLQTPFSATDQRSKLERYNELDTFLCGLKLSHLRPVFHAQEITFSQLLLLKDQDLIQMGIEKLGSRLQIIDAIKAIHKKEWETTSLLSVKSSDLTCPQTVAMVANMSKHLDYMRSTVSYLHRAIRDDNTILEKDQDVNNIYKLMKEVAEASAYDRGLQKEMEELQSYLAQICVKVEFQPVDLIEKEPEVAPQSGIKWGKATLLSAIGGGVAFSLFNLIKRH